MSVWTILIIIVIAIIVIRLAYRRFDKAARDHEQRIAKHRESYPPSPYYKPRESNSR